MGVTLSSFCVVWEGSTITAGPMGEALSGIGRAVATTGMMGGTSFSSSEWSEEFEELSSCPVANESSLEESSEDDASCDDLFSSGNTSTCVGEG